MRNEIQTPTTPNFIKVRLGSKEEVTLPISDFTDEELGQIGDRWTKDLIASAQRNRRNRL